MFDNVLNTPLTLVPFPKQSRLTRFLITTSPTQINMPIVVDCHLSFDNHITGLCRKTSQKII